MKAKYRRSLEKALTYVILTSALIFFIFPVLWTFIASIKYPVAIFEMPSKKNPDFLKPWVFTPTLDNYVDVLRSESIVASLYNSMIVAVSTTAIVTLIGTVAAYSYVRFSFRSSRLGPFFFLMTWLVPEMTLIIPFYAIQRTLGLLDTHIGLILAYVTFALPFQVWMMRGFIEELPQEIEEAALIDGCSRFMVILRIVFPNIAPGIVGTAIYVMLHCWNEFPFALVLTRFNAKTMPVMILASGIGEIGVHWGTITAFGIVAVLPMIVFTIIFQRYFVKGLTQGAVKR